MKRPLSLTAAFAAAIGLFVAYATAQGQSRMQGDLRMTGNLIDDSTGHNLTNRKMVVLGGDVSDSSGVNTYTDVTGFSFPVTSGVRTNFRIQIWYTSAATTTGAGFSLNGPTTTDLSYTSDYTASTTTRAVNNAGAYDVPTTAAAASLTTGNIALIHGTILPSANGTVIVRFMTEVDTSAITVKAGSFLEYW